MTGAAVDAPVGWQRRVDAVLAGLHRGEKAWAGVTLGRRRELLEQLHGLVGRHAQAWVDAAAGIKGLPRNSPLVGEEWISGPWALLTGLEALAKSVAALENGGSPLEGHRLGSAPGGRVTVKVLPHTGYDRLLLNGFSAEVWMKPGVTADSVRRQAGSAQRDPTHTNGVGAVLGAGNITSIAPLDVLYELYTNNRVVALKLNPIMEAMLPVYLDVFAPLIDLGALQIITGAADVGGYLVRHHLIDHVHMTGSAVTHDAIVWGTGRDAARRKADNEPLLTKPITSELGGVSPIIVLPGTWSKADLKYQAEHVATMRLHNGGYNCIAGQVVVVSADWPQKDAFLAEIRAALQRTPARKAYYPGSDSRMAKAREAYPAAENIGGRLLVTATAERTYLLQNEFFAPVLGVVELPGADFLATAVRTANEDFVGTLGVNLIAHPRTIKHLGARLDAALAELRYGCIAVNAWTGVGFLTAAGSWGAFPGHTLDDVQSGIGVVHNALFLADPERTVVRGPFRPSPRSLLNGEWTIGPKPPWFVTNRTAAGTGRALTTFAAEPSALKLAGIFSSAVRG